MRLRKSNIVYEAMPILLAIAIAIIALHLAAAPKIDLANLAKGEQNTSRLEVCDGKPYTAFTIEDIKKIVNSPRGIDNSVLLGAKRTRVLWMGNSQLHYINQYQEGDHLSPHWLRQVWKTPPGIDVLGVSLPNANFQEFLVLGRYVQAAMPVNILIVELVFDDLREDGLRLDFVEILTPDVTESIRRDSTSASTIFSRFMATQKTSDSDASKSVLSGTIQEPVERWLNKELRCTWSLWANRPQIEGNVLLGLYYLRNAVFRIKPTTVRKMIRARYDLNMAALTDMLADCERSKMAVLLYISPIRQDKPIPYDVTEYAGWKLEVGALAKQYGARLVNLEGLVPGELWGSCVGEEIDFMHFKGPGHQLVANAVLPHVENLLAQKGH